MRNWFYKVKKKNNSFSFKLTFIIKFWKKSRRAAFVALLFLLKTTLLAESFEVRALWVVRDYMTTPDKINEILNFADKNNYNHLFVQIRGRGDAYYNSRLVSRSHLLLNNDFDPLEYILNNSTRSKIKIHAWFNVYYLWSSSIKPVQNNHVLLNHPSWIDTKVPDQMDISKMLIKMQKDRKINGEGFYLAPTHPEVEAHLQNIITELLQNYSLDGIHFDYIRYHDINYGMNPTGLKFFLNYTSGVPGIPSLDIQERPSFNQFKRLAITGFLKKASLRIKAYQPYCIISAAVKPNLINARNTFGQEWDLWLTNGYIDWAVPMNYTGDNKSFQKNLKIIKDNIPKNLINNVIMGIGAYNQSPRSTGQKIYKTGKYDFGGISIFSYSVFDKKPTYATQIIKYLQ